MSLLPALLGLGLAAQPAARPGGYPELLLHYVQGQRAEAVAGLARLSYNESIQGFGELKARASRTSDKAGSAPETKQLLELLRAGAMLHWDADDAERPPSAGVEQPRQCPGRHADIAGRYAALLSQWPETRDFARRFFVTVSNSCQWDFCLESALRWARDGLKLYPRDAELLLAAGSVLEEKATQADVTTREGLGSLRQREREDRTRALLAREQLFKDARRDFEEALQAEPGLTLARVRLGRVLWRLGEREAAQRELERAVADQPVRGLLLLARLFLGKVHEDAGRLEPAIGQYRAALALDRSSQAVAVALSHALRAAGDAEGSRRALLDGLAHAGQRQASDLYWNYLTANAADAPADFDALRRETLR